MTEQIWYYEKDGQPWGPLYRAEIEILIQQKSIKGNTLVWYSSMESWAEAHTIPEFAKYFTEGPPPLPQNVRKEKTVELPPEQKAFLPFSTLCPREYRNVESLEDQRNVFMMPFPVMPEIDGVSQIQPWSRFMAKMVDYHIILLVLFVISIVLFPTAAGSESASILGELLLWPLAGLILVFIEPHFLSAYGKTPGKYIFGITVTKRDGELPTYREARTRTYNTWVNGLGFNLLLISWITLAYQWHNLLRTGITSWDRNGGFTTRHREGDFLIAMVVYIIFVCYYGYDFLNYYFNE